MVTHDMETVAEYAEEVIIFERGQVQRHTTPLQLFTEYQVELKDMGLKLPKALQLVEAINVKLNVELQLESVKKEWILSYIADFFRGRNCSYVLISILYHWSVCPQKLHHSPA